MIDDYNENEKKLNKEPEFRPLGHHIVPHLEAVLRKKGRLDVQLLENWPQIVGENLSTTCVPFKIKRQRGRVGEMVVTLFVACEGFAAVKIQHQADRIIKEINQLLSGEGIDKLKIVQKTIHDKINQPPYSQPLTQRQQAWLEEQSHLIDDEDLRDAVMRLGKNLMETGFMP